MALLEVDGPQLPAHPFPLAPSRVTFDGADLPIDDDVRPKILTHNAARLLRLA